MASDALLAVLESAARLQELVPDAVLVGGSAAALYADHRDSFDHDHVLTDLSDRFDVKAFLVVRRNQTRDYVDVAALADRYGLEASADVLAHIDDYYAEQHGSGRASGPNSLDNSPIRGRRTSRSPGSSGHTAI